MNKENPLKVLNKRTPLPSWLHRKLPSQKDYSVTDNLIQKHMLSTVCEEAKCPNRFECYSKKTATFLLLGNICTRACGFCEIGYSKNPPPPDPMEAAKVSDSVKHLQLKHVVLTQVARDDLEDGGASFVAKTIETIRQENENVTVEVLTSDFQANLESLDTIFAQKPEIFNYNIETVRRLTPKVRHKATYERTLHILRYAKEHHPEAFIKSGLMVGLGETKEEVRQTYIDLKEVGVDIITIGQYMQPSKKKLSVKSYVHPDQFKEYEQMGRDLGISFVHAGPYVRSSYNAQEVFNTIKKKELDLCNKS